MLVTALLLGSATAQPLTVTILHTNDLHSRFEPVQVGGQNRYAGYAYLGALIREFMQTETNPVLLDAGDVFQGTLHFNLYQGRGDAIVMNNLGYRAMAVGNHEFDLGPEALADFARRVNFPLLAANLDVSGEPLLADLIKPYTILEVGGGRVGIVGALTNDTPLIASPGENVRFLDEVESVRRAVASLHEQGVRNVVLLSHMGALRDREVVAQVPGIGVVVSSHTHTLLGRDLSPDFPQPAGDYPFVVEHAAGQTLQVSAWEWGKVLGRLRVTFDEQGRVTEYEGAPVAVRAGEDAPQDPTIARVVQTLSGPIAVLRATVVGRTAGALDGSREVVRNRESSMANAIADAMLLATQNAGSQIALMNSGGVRASLPAGNVTFEDAITVQPFGNTITVLQLTGAEIRAALEHGVSRHGTGAGEFLQVSRGFSYTFDPTRAAGQRVTAVTFEGQPLDNAATYRVVTNNFIADGGDGFAVLRAVPRDRRLDTGLLDVDVLVQYLRANERISNETENRIVIQRPN